MHSEIKSLPYYSYHSEGILVQWLLLLKVIEAKNT